MPARKNLIGKTFGRWVVESFSHTKINAYWNCTCECGNKSAVSGSMLTSGRSQSCGCLKAEKFAEMWVTHDMRHTPEYETWARMKARCFNQSNPAYRHYGGRGITVCDEWTESFEAFYRDIGQRPSPAHSLERDDNQRGYEPGNCRWATKAEQANNRRNVKLLSHNGKTQSTAEWAREIGISYWALRQRLNRGWTLEKALNPEIDGRLV